MDLLDNAGLDWIHYTGSEHFDYPIDYWGAVLEVRGDGHIDLLYRWEPNALPLTARRSESRLWPTWPLKRGRGRGLPAPQSRSFLGLDRGLIGA